MDEQLEQLTKQVLEQGYLLSLGTLDVDGVWVADVIYTFDDDFTIYWMSKDDRRHSLAIAQNPEVAGTITLTTGPDTTEAGLQLSGRAEQVTDIPRSSIDIFLRKRQKNELTVPDGHFWYKLSLERIELIYSTEFGFKRQKVK